MKTSDDTKEKEIIIILGMHRSGTSVLANMVSESGYYSGEKIMPSSDDNPKGYYENLDIVAINNKLLSLFDLEWDYIDNPAINRFKLFLPFYLDDFYSEGLEIIDGLISEHDKVFIKDPRMCLTLPFWEKIFRDLKCKVKYIFLFRKPDDVYMSLKKRNKMAECSAKALWFNYNFLALKNLNEDFCVCSFEDLQNFAGDFVNVIKKYTGINIDDKKYSGIVDGSQVHHSSSPGYDSGNKIEKMLFLKLADYKNSIVSPSKIKNDIEGIETQDINKKSDSLQVFINTGNAYREEESQSIPYDADSDTQFKVDMRNYKTVNSLRIDPSEEKCIIVIKAIDIVYNDGTKLRITSTFGNYKYCIDSTYVFPLFDPQMYFTGIKDKHEIESLLIDFEKLDFNSFSNAFFEKKLISEYEYKIYKFNKEIAEMQEMISRLDHRGSISYILHLPFDILRKSLNFLFRPVQGINKLHLLMKKKDASIFKVWKYFKIHGLKRTIYRSLSCITGKDFSLAMQDYIYETPELTDEIKDIMENFKHKPLLSIIMPVYNVQADLLDKAISSIKNQWYDNWELCIVDDCSTREDTLTYLKGINDVKIKFKRLNKNHNISGASNIALSMANGKYVTFIDNDDEITPDAFYEIVKSINDYNADFIYSDEDKIDMNGKFFTPHFKPDFSSDMLYSQNYISHLGAIRKDLLNQIGGFEEGLEGAQDYDLYLKVIEKTNKIVHIPKVLYHWRKVPGSTACEHNEKSYAQEAGRKAIENSLKRQKLKATVANGNNPGTYRVQYEITGKPLITIIIPFKDEAELLRQCIKNILKKSSYINYEIIGISNNSEDKKTFLMMEKLKKLDSRISFYEYNVPFNYPRINNYAVKEYAKGEYIILLNNDVEIITPDWIENMLGFAQRRFTGAVGCKLYYPNDTLQHGGIIIGLGGIAGHSHKNFSKYDNGYFYRPHIDQNFCALTAACLMVSKNKYLEVGGFDNNLDVAFNDVDFCLRLMEKGYHNVYTPYSEAYHHESFSRGAENTAEKIERFGEEILYMKKRHKKILQEGDPFYNQNLTLVREDFSMR